MNSGETSPGPSPQPAADVGLSRAPRGSLREGPGSTRPKHFMPHATMSSEEIRQRTQGVWDSFYSFSEIWKRASCVKTLKSKLAFLLISKLYRQMYASTGIATDSARRKSANRWARWLAKPTQRLFQGKPMPDLAMPVAVGGRAALVVIGQ